jgi:hypothetical protein
MQNKEVEEEYKKALASLPENLRQLIMQGFRPSYHKRLKRWILRKKVYGKDNMVYVPNEFSDAMQIIKAYNMKKVEKLADASDYVLEGKIREIPKEERKPIMKKEIEDAAWTHNLYHDLGKYAYHQLVKYVEWSPNDTKDSEQAFNKLRNYFDTLLKYRDQAKIVQGLQEQILRYDMFTTYLESQIKEVVEYVNELKATIEKQQLFIQLLLNSLDPNTAKRMLAAFAAAIEASAFEQKESSKKLK